MVARRKYPPELMARAVRLVFEVGVRGSCFGAAGFAWGDQAGADRLGINPEACVRSLQGQGRG